MGQASETFVDLVLYRIIRWLRQLECFQTITFDQCIFSCAAKKPTTLLLLRLGDLVHRVRGLGLGGRCAHPRGFHIALSGRDESGAFRTSVAKIYPAAMNAALADSIAHHALGLASDMQRVEPLQADLQPFQSYDFVDTEIVQPDYYR